MGAIEVWAYAWHDHPATDVAGFATALDSPDPRIASFRNWGAVAEHRLAALVGWLAANGGLASGLAAGS